MRPVTITLGVLVRDDVNDNAWPGVEEDVLFNDAACPSVEEGDNPKFIVEQGFVVMGFDASASDSFPAPDGWQYFDQGDAALLIPGWAAASLEWHPATKITCSNNPENFWIVSNSFFDVQNSFNLCCGTPTILTQAYSLKQSNQSLNPDEPNPPCGTDAAFKWLAVWGTNENRELDYTFEMWLWNADMSVALSLNLPGHNVQDFTQTVQHVKRWPEDFIGLTLSGVTLVANDVEPGDGEMQVKDFDNGTIGVYTSILGEDEQFVSQALNTFRLPATDCAAVDLCPTPTIEWSTGGGSLPPFTPGVPYNITGQINGAGPFTVNLNDKPDWMDFGYDAEEGTIFLNGTPDTLDNENFDFDFGNCNEEQENFTQTLEADLGPEDIVFQIVAGEETLSKDLGVSTSINQAAVVEWGDGNTELFSMITGLNMLSHVYGAPGTYGVKIHFLQTPGAISGLLMPNQGITGNFDYNSFRLTNLGNVILDDNAITQVSFTNTQDNLQAPGNNFTGAHNIVFGNIQVTVDGSPLLTSISGSSSTMQHLYANNCGLTDLGMNPFFTFHPKWGVAALKSFGIANSTGVTDISPANIPDGLTYLNVAGTGLGVSQINDSLVKLDTAGLSNGTFISTGTAAPTGAGATAKAALILKGWTVTTD